MLSLWVVSRARGIDGPILLDTAVHTQPVPSFLILRSRNSKKFGRLRVEIPHIRQNLNRSYIHRGISSSTLNPCPESLSRPPFSGCSTSSLTSVIQPKTTLLSSTSLPNLVGARKKWHYPLSWRFELVRGSVEMPRKITGRDLCRDSGSKS